MVPSIFVATPAAI